MKDAISRDDSYNEFLKENVVDFIELQLDVMRKCLHDNENLSDAYINLLNKIIKEAHRFAPNERFIFQWIDDKENKK